MATRVWPRSPVRCCRRVPCRLPPMDAEQASFSGWTTFQGRGCVGFTDARFRHLNTKARIATAARAPHEPASICFGDSLGGEARSEEQTSEIQYLMRLSYAVFCLKKKNNT